MYPVLSILEAKQEIPEMAASCRPCAEGQGLCHLRRIGIRAPLPTVTDLIHFDNPVTLMGRDRGVVNYFFSAAVARGRQYISRIHARVIRNADKFVLVDSSLTGVYVNDLRICDRIDLQEGDTVTFGHPEGRKIKAGARVRQPNSPFYFLFERCHCSASQMQCLCDDKRVLPNERPALVSVGTSLPANTSLGHVAQISPSCATDAHRGPQYPDIITLTAPLTSAVATVSSAPTNSFNMTSSLPKEPSQIGPPASTFSSLEDVRRPASRLLRSTSPDYIVLGESSLVSSDSSPQTTLEVTDNLSLQGSPESDGSELLSDRSQSAAGCKPNSNKPLQDANGKSILGPCCLDTTIPAFAQPSLLSPTCSGSGASDHDYFESERPVNPTLDFFQAEDRDSPDSRRSVSNTEVLDTGSSDCEEETLEQSICQSTEEIADCGHQVMMEVEEQRKAVSSAKRRSAERMEEEDFVEEEEENSPEISLCGASLLETDGAGNMASNLSVRMHVSPSAKSGSNCLDSANKTSGDFSSGKEPESDSCTELVGQDALDPEDASAASLPRSLPCGFQSGGDDCDLSTDSGRDMEMQPHTNASLLTLHNGHFGTGEAGCPEPEVSTANSEAVDASFAETSCANVETQMGYAKEVEMDMMTVGPAEDGDANRSPGILGHDELKTSIVSFSTSPIGFLADGHLSDESSREGERAAQEDVIPEDLREASEEEEALVFASSPAASAVLKETVPEGSLEDPVPEKIIHVKFYDESLSQSSETPSDRKEEEAALAERKLEEASPRPAKAGESLQEFIAEPMQEDEKEVCGNDCPLLGTASALVEGLPRGEEPGSDSDSEPKCQEELDNYGEGGSAIKKGISSTLAASGKDGDSQQETAEESGLEKALEAPEDGCQERAGSDLSEGSLARGLEEEAPQPSEDSAGRKLRERSPFPGIEVEGILELPSEADKKKIGERLAPESNYCLPCQGGAEDERATSLNDKSMMEVKGHSASERTLASVSIDQTKVDCKQNNTQAVELLNDGRMHLGTRSDSCTSLVHQEESPVSSDPQEGNAHRAEGLEHGMAVKACEESSAGKPEDSLMEGNTWEPDVVVGHLTPLGPEGDDKETTLYVEEEFGQALERSPCNERKGSLLVSDVPGIDTEKPGDAETGLVPSDSGSSKVPEMFRDDELHVHSSDLDAEEEVNEDAEVSSATATASLHPGRADFLSNLAVGLVSGFSHKNSEVCEKLIFGSTDLGSSDTAVQKPNVGSWEGAKVSHVGLEQQNSFHCESNSYPDHVGRKLLPLVKNEVLGEEQEGWDITGVNLVPANPSSIIVEPSCLSENDVNLVTEEQAPDNAGGLAEDAGLVLDHNDCLSSHPEEKILAGPVEDGETVKEHSGSDVPASLCSQEEEYAQKNGVKTLLEQHGEAKTRLCHGHKGQLDKRLVSSVGFGENLCCLEYQRTFLQKEEESKGSSSRKRHLEEDQEQLFGRSGSEGGSFSEKRPCPLACLLIQGPPLDRPLPTMAVPSPPRKEGHLNQVGKTIATFLDQYSSHVTLHSEEARKRNRDRVAQIVRNYFKNSSWKPATENGDEGMSRLSAEVAKDMDFGSLLILEAGESGSDDEPISPEEQAKSILSQASSPESQNGTSGTVSSQSSSPAREEDQDSESIGEAYFSEEEDFQLQICSQLNNPPPESPVQSHNAEPVPGEKDLDFFFSDISNTSVDPDLCKPSVKPHGRGSSGVRKDRFPEGASDMAVEATEINTVSEFYCETSNEDWDYEDPGTPLDASSQEGTHSDPDHHVTVAPEKSDALCHQEAEAMSDSDDGGEASGIGGFERTKLPPASLATGQEEEDGGPRGVQTEEVSFSQRSHMDFSCADRECEPAINLPPSASSPWKSISRPLGCPHAPLKREPSNEDHGCQNDSGQESPSLFQIVPVAAAAFKQESCPIVVGIKEEVSPPESSSVICPVSTQTKLTFLQNGSCLLSSSVVRDGFVEADGSNDNFDGACGRIRSRNGRSTFSLLPSSEASSPLGITPNVKERDIGDHLGKDVSRYGKVARLPGQMDSTSASQAIPGETRTLPGIGAFDNQVLSCSSMQSKEGVPLLKKGQLALVPSASQVFKEERDLCDPQDQRTSSGPGTPYPVACSPVISVLPKPHMPDLSAASQPESSGSPVDLGSGDRLLLPYHLEEPELESEHVNSDNECEAGRMSLGSEEGDSSTSSSCPHAASITQAQSNPWLGANGPEGSTFKGWASSEQDIQFQLQECQSVLAEISKSLSGVEGIDDTHLEKWRDQIALLQKATKMPQTFIAVVGNTGAGKSCLLNALLDEEAVLPTSDMRACTAVVVEVSRAAGGSPYEAEVEFLSREEWYKELRALLEDMKDKSGNLKRRCPDRKTEAGAAYCRVKAVYGRIEELEKLEQMQEVTQYLGTVKHLSAETATAFRSSIEKFIDSRTDNLREMKGGEFWPIVKCVKIRVANSEVLKTGAVLVDLPGTRDSNAARDEAAKEYLKDCNAVWVVASITRAVDDKTAKEMLSASLRRQLLMDGRYGSLAFVCTKTDSFNITDIVRDLKLQNEIQCVEDELRELENQRMQAETEKRSLYEYLQREEQRQPGDGADSSWLQREHDILVKEFRISDLQRQKEAKLRAISLICVLARNKFSKQQILMDFNAGLEEMTRKALDPECEEDSDEEMEEGDAAGSGSPGLGEAESRPKKLQVFTVSSTEYLKLCGKLLRDGQPQVFHDTKDTEIPALKKFAIDTALKHSMEATERVIRDVARVLSQMVNYLTSQRAEDHSHQAQIQEIVQRFLRDVPIHLQDPVECSIRDVQHCFGGLIRDSLQKGAARAKERCQAIVRSWGSPCNGLPHATYHAVCCRHGVYTSPMYGCVDFNRDLAQPIQEAVSITWNEVFSMKLLESVKCFNAAVLAMLQSIFKDLEGRLKEHSRIAEAVHSIFWQQMEATRAKLINFTLDLMGYVTRRQREISRLLMPEIKGRMEPAYAACSQMSGRGYFQLMKEKMESYTHREKEAIFDSAIEKLLEQLGQLQQCIQEKFQNLVRELTRSLKMQFEPILKPVQKNGKIIPELMTICAKVDKLCRRSCVDYILPCPVLAADRSPGMEEELVWAQDPMNCGAMRADIYMGSATLPSLTAIQPSVCSASNQEVKTLAVPASLHLPKASAAAQQQPQHPPVPLHPGGKKRAGETPQPELEKRHKGQGTVPGEGGDLTGQPLQNYSGMTQVKPEPGFQDFASPLLPTPSQAPAPEDCRQKASEIPGPPQTHVAMKVEGLASPGSSGKDTRNCLDRPV